MEELVLQEEKEILDYLKSKDDVNQLKIENQEEVIRILEDNIFKSN